MRLLFRLLSIGEAIWVVMETYCLARAVQYERSVIWKEGTSAKTMISEIVCLTLFFYLCLNFLRFERHDETMWKFWIFTQVLVTAVPVWEMRKRGDKSGNCLLLRYASARSGKVAICARVQKEPLSLWQAKGCMAIDLP